MGAIAVQLHAVSYKYPHSDKVALSEVSYTFSRGATAIVGPNGAGKSTMVKLLIGLLTPTSGRISVQLPGRVYLPPEELRKAVLFQEPSHLYLSIRQNITMRFERTPGEDARIYGALEKAGLGKVVNGLPDGIDTLVGAGFGGQTDLSGGQWQRLALARLIYQEAPMIILDEPVASLDPQGERAVFELFSQLSQSKIIIFTTHRYDSIPGNTKIVVLVDGNITESGTHEELLQKQRDYWSLYMSETLERTVPEPALAGRPDRRIHTMNGQTNPGMAEFPLIPRSTSLKTSSTPNLVPQLVTSISNGQGNPPPTSNAFHDSPLAKSTLNPPPAPPVSPSPGPPVPSSSPDPASTGRNGGSFMTKLRNGFLFMLFILLAATTLGALYVLPHRNTSTAISNPVIGHVYFLSSGQLYVNNNQGINDQMLIDLHNVADPAPGKSYYAWLLGDANLSEPASISLGQVSVNRGNIHFLFPGDEAHINLLNNMSRFVITEEDANTAPDNPILDQGSWRYYGEIYQIPSVKDVNHFSLLDHLRHLLVQAPELAALGLPGGLSIWMVRNVEEISNWALTAKDSSEVKKVAFIRQQLVNILYYLDGECTQADLQGLPPGTPTLPGNGTIAHIAHFALLNQCVQEEQEQANALKQVFGHTSHNCVDHLLFHMTGVIQSPGATSYQRSLSLQINTAINNVKTWLGQVHQDAVRLLHMTNAQLTGISGLEILGELEAQARYAYAGRTDPSSGMMQQGATWIYDNVERLATFDVTAYLSR